MVGSLEAELGSHPTQIWRAILDGRDISVQGIVPRIQDGETTNIWAHNWISRDNIKRPITSLVQYPPSKVAQLIDATIASWKEDLVRSTFTPFDASEILKIPLCTGKVTDFWAWHEESHGILSVRSAYHVILRTKLGQEAWLHEDDGSDV